MMNKRFFPVLAGVLTLWSLTGCTSPAGNEEHEYAQPVYGITVSVIQPYTFPPATLGYGGIGPKAVTVTNTGDQATGPLVITLGGTSSDSFTLDKDSIPGGIAVEKTDTFTVVPKPGLDVGSYIATVTVSSETGGFNAGFTVSFMVTPVPTYGISLSGTEPSAFSPAAVGYGTRPEKRITITNTGNQSTGPLTAAFSGSGSGSFSLDTNSDLSTLSITSIAAGETAYFTVVPKTGLGVDSNTGLDFEIYTDTVTVSGEHGISTHFDVSFRVYVPGKADIVIAAWVDEDGNLITGNQGPVSISKTAEDTVTVTAAAELENIQWSIDTVPIGPPRGTAGSITIEAANYPVGTYILGLLAYKNGVPYSTTLEVRIDE